MKTYQKHVSFTMYINLGSGDDLHFESVAGSTIKSSHFVRQSNFFIPEIVVLTNRSLVNVSDKENCRIRYPSYSLKHCQAGVFPQTQTLYSLCFVLIASCFLLNQKKISSYLKLSSYLRFSVLSTRANVIFNYPYHDHNVSHARVEVLLPRAVGRLFKQNR